MHITKLSLAILVASAGLTTNSAQSPTPEQYEQALEGLRQRMAEERRRGNFTSEFPGLVQPAPRRIIPAPRPDPVRQEQEQRALEAVRQSLSEPPPPAPNPSPAPAAPPESVAPAPAVQEPILAAVAEPQGNIYAPRELPPPRERWQPPVSPMHERALQALREAMADSEPAPRAPAPVIAVPDAPVEPPRFREPQPPLAPRDDIGDIGQPASLPHEPQPPAERRAPTVRTSPMHERALQTLRQAMEAERPSYPAVALPDAPVVSRPSRPIREPRAPLRPRETPPVVRQDVPPAEAAPVEPPPPLMRTRQQRLAELLELYRADRITPTEYHRERARILGEP